MACKSHAIKIYFLTDLFVKRMLGNQKVVLGTEKKLS